MYLKTLLFGLFFLITPEVSTFDLLPDFIGCLLIIKAISKLALISEEAEEAKKHFLRLLAVSAVKTVLFFPLLTIGSTDGGIYLAFTAAFAVLTTMFTVPALRELYLALSTVSDRGNKTSVKISGLYIFSMIFFLLKAVMSFFPEIVYIPIFMNGIANSAYIPNAFMKAGVAAISVLITLIVGIAFYIFACIKLSKICKRDSLSDYIFSEAKKIEIPKKSIILSSVSTCFLLIRIMMFCSIAFAIDGVNVIPEFVPPILALFALSRLKKIGLFNLNAKISACISVAFGTAAYISVSIFADEYNPLANANFLLVREYFTFPAVFEMLYHISFAIVLIYITKLISSVVSQHTGSIWETAFRTHNKEEITRKKNHILISKILILFAVLLSLSNGVSYLLLYTSDSYGFINGIAGLVVAIAFNEYLHSVKSSCEEMYLTA